jgi:hypothetical protein
MATKNFFDNKIVKLPGAYSTIVSGVQSQPLSLDFGKVLVIDTGVLGATWGGGSGIAGELAVGQDSVYRFNDLSSYQSFLKGGMFWKMADALFKPDKKSGANGVSEVWHARAATTTNAKMTFTATGGGAAGGSFKFDTRDEGLNANGTVTSSHLDKGYAYTIETGVVDTAKWIFKVWLGSWKGNHTDGIAYDEIAKADSPAILLVTSPEFNNIAELISWANTNTTFGKYFVLDATSAVIGTGVVNQADVTAVAGYQVATGATETYASARMDEILAAVADQDFSFILTDLYGVDDYDDADITKILSFINGSSKFKRFLYVGGGSNEDQFDSSPGSLAMGAYYNSAYVHLVHGEYATASDSVPEGFRWWPSVCHAALMLGRTAGKEPQVPLTNKSIGVDKLRHNPTKAQKERALDAGVKMTVWNGSLLKFVCLQDINTLQDNTRLFTPAGKSHQGSFMRIIEQINKELVVNAEIDLLSDENGVNVNTLGAGTLKNWTETYLESRLAKIGQDNLILSYKDVTVTRNGDQWNVTYGIVVNNEINKIFFTGFLLS